MREADMMPMTQTNPIDSVSMDVPLLLRIMEFAREDAKTDMALHDVTENLIRLSNQGRTLTMNDYDAIVGGVEQDRPVGEQDMDEGTYNQDVERAFPGGVAPGVKTGPSAPKGTSTMPTDKEKAKGQPVGTMQQGVDEGAEFGAYYCEQLAQQVYDENPNLSTSGRAEELLNAGWAVVAQKFGKKRANYMFNYDEDFSSDFVSSYGFLQDGGNTQEGLEEVAPEGWEGTVKAMKKHGEIDNPWALAHYMKGKGYHSHKTRSGKDKNESMESAPFIKRVVENEKATYSVYNELGECVLDGLSRQAAELKLQDIRESK